MLSGFSTSFYGYLFFTIILDAFSTGLFVFFSAESVGSYSLLSVARLDLSSSEMGVKILDSVSTVRSVFSFSLHCND